MPSIDGIPEDVTRIGSVTIALYLTEAGTAFGYGVEGMSREAALGYLMAVTDRVRDDIKYDWDDTDGEGHACLGPECPQCGFSIQEPEEDDEDE